MESSKVDPLLVQEMNVPVITHGIWLFSTLTFSRNLEKFLFPLKSTLENRKQIIALVAGALLGDDALDHPRLIEAQNCSPIDKEYLYEHFFSAKTFMHAHNGEAFIVDRSGEFLVVMNVHDHLELAFVDYKGELETTLNRLIGIESRLGEKTPFAYNQKFGFLTGRPSQSGTALSVQLFLQLPALVHLNLLDHFIAEQENNNVTFNALYGNPRELIGDLLIVENRYSLAVSEDEILSSLRAFAMQAILAEKRARALVKRESNEAMKDHVSRAYGLINHSYKLELKEALNALSLMKLGLDVGWIEGVTAAQLDRLFFQARRAHLEVALGKNIALIETAHARSDFLKEECRKAHLLL